MFQFHAHSKELADAVRKISIAIPPASQKGGNDGIKLALYKESKKVPNDMGVLLAYDGKIQAVSTMPIQDVSADEDMMEIHVSGRKMEAAAYAFAALDTILEVTINKDVEIRCGNNKVTLQQCQEIVALKNNLPPSFEITMDTNDFVDFINFASCCHGEEKGSRGFHCVGIRVENGKISAMSSNGTRCAYAEIPNVKIRQVNKAAAKKANGEEKEVVQEEKELPITVVLEGKQIKNAVKNLTKEKVTIGVDSKIFRIKCGTDVILILTQEIAYPMDALLQILEKCQKTGAWKAQLNKVFQALGIYEITMEKPWLKISKSGEGQISFQGKDEQTNAAVVCAQEGEISTVVLNEKELKTSLSIFAKDQDIIVETSSKALPVVIRQNEDDPNRIVVMPITED
jgi:DNA polymerase III sliding clamp (beta) subunit (PCNA family)